MKAIQFERLGGPEVMQLREIPRPELRPGTVLVKNQVIALNYGDTFFIRGQYLVKPAFPDTPGMEAAGVIEEVAPDVKGLTPGMRVAYIGMGAYAEYTRIRPSRVMAIPDFMDFEQAAAFPIAVLTAWHLLHTCHRIDAGETVIVHSAAGGVGIAAVQIAKAAGARVIGTVSADHKIDFVRRYGADEVINYATHDFAEESMRLGGGRGVDLILDAVGKPTFGNGLKCLAPFGHLILYGSAGGPPDPINPMMMLFAKSLKVSGFVVPMVYAMHEIHQRGVDDVFRLAREGRLTVPIGQRFALSEAVEALRFLESRRSVGKLLLIP
ncbi:MAG: quinone oxidoreductase [Candidatus Binatus sp.]|uniref:quinone oxidoreductase family protein n=1 Tax=Candidatus Binatus sp. TaxID=2811406 RepID=UPI00271C10D2|nr:quinone oxidoreductase [Candidatus Binatus sp.]MDO8435041.1 quinone oxidoreductase [Candidatus Binatus sp.]